MPKEVLPHAEWVKRLRLYAKGEYVFGRGNAPSQILSGQRGKHQLIHVL